MRRTLLRGGALVGTTAAAALVAGALPAAAAPAQDGPASAYGAYANVQLLGQDLLTVPPTPKATLGNSPDDLAHLKLSPIARASALHVSAVKLDSGTLRSNATVASLSLLGGVIKAKTIDTTCVAKPGQKPHASTTIASLTVNGKDKGGVLENVSSPKSIKVGLPGLHQIAEITVNDETTSKDGSLTAQGLHITLLKQSNLARVANAEIVLSSATCGPAKSGGNEGGNPPGTNPPGTNPPGTPGGGDNGGAGNGGAGNGAGNGNGNGNGNGGNGNGITQVSKVPKGAADTGGGSTAGIEDPWLFGLGGALILASGGTLALAYRRRLAGQR